MSSTDRIARLSPKQEKALEQAFKRWKATGLSTAPTDRATAEAGVKEAYMAAGLEPPKLILWLPSAWAGNTAVKLLESHVDWPAELNQAQLEVWDSVWKQLLKATEQLVGAEQWQAVRRDIRNKANQKILEKNGLIIEKQVKELFTENLGIYIWKQLRAAAGSPVTKQLREIAENQVKANIEGKLSASVSDRIYHELVKRVHQQCWSYVAEPLRQSVPAMAGVLAGAQKWQGAYGLHDSGWISFYDFVRELGVAGTEPLDGYIKLTQSCGWWWAFKNLCVLTDRPVELHRDNRSRLHNETGMCMRFADNWGIYGWHGVLVPGYVILLSEPLTFSLIEAEPNAEIRRVLIERFGLENYLREGRVVKLHQDGCGILYRMNMENDEPIIVVRVKNSTPEPDGTIKEYFLRVPPNMVRARQAVAWTFGLTEEEYAPLIET